MLLRAAQIYVQAAQAVGDGPLEHRRVRGGETRRQRGEQRQRARLVARLDDDERHAAAKQRFQLAARVGRRRNGAMSTELQSALAERARLDVRPDVIGVARAKFFAAQRQKL